MCLCMENKQLMCPTCRRVCIYLGQENGRPKFFNSCQNETSCQLLTKTSLDQVKRV